MVLEVQARRPADIQLRIADWITGSAGLMIGLGPGVGGELVLLRW